MDFKTYRPLALRTAKMFPTARENLRHSVLGLITEVGEFATIVKRIAVYGKPWTDEMRAHAREELGDAGWYLPLGLKAAGDGPLDEGSAAHEESMSRVREVANGKDLADLTLLLGLMVGMAAVAYLDVDEDGDFDPESVYSAIMDIHVLIDHFIAPQIGFEPGELRSENIEKLKLRFPDAYSDAAAEARADKGGLDARVS